MTRTEEVAGMIVAAIKRHARFHNHGAEAAALCEVRDIVATDRHTHTVAVARGASMLAKESKPTEYRVNAKEAAS